MSNMLEPLRQLASRELGIADGDLDSHLPFAELGLDSLMLVDFMFAVEDQFHIQIDHDEAMKTPTLAGLATLVERLIAEAPAAANGTSPKIATA